MSAFECYAVTHPGLESLTAAELLALGVVGEVGPGGVSFPADLGLLCAANLHLRTASRVLVRVGSFAARTFPELERHAGRLPWDLYLGRGAAVAFRVTSRKSRLYHQNAIAERLLTAARNAVGEVAAAKAAESDADSADAQLFVVRVVRDQVVVSADSSGALLHRRGYRLASGKAPLRETLAAGMLLALGWDGSVPLIDPFCGSGTIPIEGALLARRIPPGISRQFQFEGWTGFDAEILEGVRAAARAQVLPGPPREIVGADRDAGAIESAGANAERAAVGADVEFRRAALSALEPPAGPGLLLTNPPYGVRVGERLRLRDLYAQLGNIARRQLEGWEIALLTSRAGLERQAAVPFRTIFETSNGGLPVRLVAARLE
ncbi:MAG TPA: hypothetical protein VK012_07280 [Gemmatimonadales bacterium]|nr:hypothetical protein [Gemmatimonadales bacterium]